jgi:hypothetical protein
MSRSLCLILALLAWFSASSLQGQPRELPVDWLFLIDTSQSMIGKGGAADIFDKVQRSLKSFVRTARPGDSVAIYTFDSRVVPGESILLGNQEDRKKLFEQIDSLRANGLFTHTGEAFYSALVRQEELHQPAGGSDRKGFIVLFTDGIEDTRDQPGASQIRDIELPPRSKRPYAIFVWLGEEVQEFERSSLSTLASEFGDKAKVLQHPQARDIDHLVTELRDITSKEARNRVELNTLKVDFGNLQPDLGSKSEKREIIVYAEKELRVGYELDDPRVEVVEPLGPLNLIPGENHLPFVLKVKKEGDSGRFSSELTLQRYDAEDVPTIGTVALVYGIAKRSYAREIVILLAILAFATIAVRRTKVRRHLFGVLDVSRTGVAASRIDLSSLKRPRAQLAELLGRPSAEGDADLSVGRQENGERVVRLSNAKGPISLNGKLLENDFVEEVFNGDRLTLGDQLVIRYSGPERPEPSEEIRQIGTSHSR